MWVINWVYNIATSLHGNHHKRTPFHCFFSVSNNGCRELNRTSQNKVHTRQVSQCCSTKEGFISPNLRSSPNSASARWNLYGLAESKEASLEGKKASMTGICVVVPHRHTHLLVWLPFCQGCMLAVELSISTSFDEVHCSYNQKNDGARGQTNIKWDPAFTFYQYVKSMWKEGHML